MKNVLEINILSLLINVNTAFQEDVLNIGTITFEGFTSSSVSSGSFKLYSASPLTMGTLSMPSSCKCILSMPSSSSLLAASGSPSMSDSLLG